MLGSQLVSTWIVRSQIFRAMLDRVIGRLNVCLKIWIVDIDLLFPCRRRRILCSDCAVENYQRDRAKILIVGRICCAGKMTRGYVGDFGG